MLDFKINYINLITKNENKVHYRTYKIEIVCNL